jgi:hypothetical protein
MKLYDYSKKQRDFVIKFVKDIFNFDNNIDNLTPKFKREFYMGYYSSVEEIDRAYELRLACEETLYKARFEFALSLLEQKVPMETIIKATKFSKKEILAIAKEMKKS